MNPKVKTELILSPPIRTVELTMSDGALIRVRQHGRSGLPRLVLSHGNGLAINAYLPFWDRLAVDHELLVFDVRNHGENPPHDPMAHTWPRITEDMGEIFDGIQRHFGPASTVGVFHSLSAIAALLHEMRGGSNWHALVLFDPPLNPPAEHPLHKLQKAHMVNMARRALRRPTTYDSPEQFARQLERHPDFALWVAGETLLFARSTLRADERGKWVLRNPRELEARMFAENVDTAIWERFPLLVPTMLIGADPNLPGARPPALSCRALHDEVGIDYACIVGTSHFLQLENPAACQLALKRFLHAH